MRRRADRAWTPGVVTFALVAMMLSLAVGGVETPASASTFKRPTYVVTTRRVAGLGVILVDGKGQTLYVYAPDRASGASKCYSICAAEWPPLELPAHVEKPVAAGKAKTALLGTTKRVGGGTQVTYKGWPLYRFAPDETPGSASGEALDNLGGKWYVLAPSGAEVR